MSITDADRKLALEIANRMDRVYVKAGHTRSNIADAIAEGIALGRQQGLELAAKINTDELSSDPLNYLEHTRDTLLQSQRELALALDQHYLFVSARRVMVYYFSIVAVFVAILFVNYTARLVVLE